MFGLFGPSKEKHRMCNSKRRFKSEADAKHALDLINPGKAKANRPNRVYKCPHCGGYHLTRSPKF